jgi:hypothetical protein
MKFTCLHRLLHAVLIAAAFLMIERSTYAAPDEDRTERLHEKVTTTDAQIDVRKSKAESRRINSPAFQAVRKAEAHLTDARARVATLENGERQRAARAVHDLQGAEAHSNAALQRARGELRSAEDELKEAQARLRAQVE